MELIYGNDGTFVPLPQGCIAAALVLECRIGLDPQCEHLPWRKHQVTINSPLGIPTPNQSQKLLMTLVIVLHHLTKSNSFWRSSLQSNPEGLSANIFGADSPLRLVLVLLVFLVNNQIKFASKYNKILYQVKLRMMILIFCDRYKTLQLPNAKTNIQVELPYCRLFSI